MQCVSLDEGNMPMRKRSFLSRFAKAFDKWFDNMEANCKTEKIYRKYKTEEEAMEALIKMDEEINKALGLPPLDAKNPYRFW